MSNKVKLHIPTEQYGYVEFEVELEPEDAIAHYNEIVRAARAGDGLEKKEFDAFIDRYLEGEDNHIEQYEKMNAEQKTIVQCIKRSLARIDYKHKKQA